MPSLMPRRLLLPALIANLCAAPSFAAGTAITTSPVVVSATRVEQSGFDLPVSIDSLNKEQLQEGQLQVNLSESLVRVPGIVAQNRQNYAQDLQISSRGFGARSSFGVRGLRIYSDGIPATMPDGQGQISHIDLGSAARVEVMRGPFSALYGNSSGGVISVFTEDGAPGARIEPALAFGSYGTQRLSTKLSGDSGRFNYVADVSSFRTDGYRDHSAAKRDNLNTKLRWKLPNDASLTLVVNAVEMPDIQDALGLTRAQYEADPRQAGTNALAYNTRKSVAQQQIGINLEHKVGADDTVNLTLHRGHRDTIQYQSIPAAFQGAATHPGGVIDLTRDYWGLDARWTHRGALAGKPLITSAGLSHEDLDEARKGFQNFIGAQTGVLGALRRNEDNRISSFDQYLQTQWEASSDWRLLAGVRHASVKITSTDKYIVAGNVDDSGSTKFSATTGSLGAVFRATDAANVYLSWGKGFETPTMNELSYQPGGAAGLNFALQAATSTHLELGVKALVGNDTRLNAALFSVDTDKEIAVATSVGGRTTFQYAGRTRRTGLELGADTHWQNGLALALAYTHLTARYQDTLAGSTIVAGNFIPGIPQKVLFAELSWRHAPSGFLAAVNVRSASKVWVNDGNTDAAPANTVTGLRLGFEQKSGGWTLKEFLRIDNLGDQKYAGSVIVNEGNSRFFESAPGRNHLLGLSASYGF
ncbi:MAG: TonB-dependent receptor [Sulfuritalea sp.]|nr:TonB-dependent receptor [Sulfuritalea sp.]MDP1985023.1 TonB-dependent receptor [Sulfuritalea sp.]